MVSEHRELPFNHPIAIYLRGPCGRDRRLNRSMVAQLGLDPDYRWRFESVLWQPPGATAVVTLNGFPLPQASARDGLGI